MLAVNVLQMDMTMKNMNVMYVMYINMITKM